MCEVKPAIVRTIPIALAALVSGLYRGHAEASALDKLRFVGGFWSVMDGLNNRKKAAG